MKKTGMVFLGATIITFQNRGFQYKVLSVVLGILAFLLIYGPKVLNPSYIDWVMNADSGTHYVGWSFFRNSQWSFPLGFIPDLIYPIGTMAANQDVIPLIAFPAKMFSNLYGEDFQYFGFWILITFALQSLFAYLILNHLTKSAPYALLGSLFLTLSPYFLYREELLMRGLASHWTILAVFYISLISISQQNRLGTLILLNCTTVFIHPYLAVMVFCFSIASLLTTLTLRTGFAYALLLLVFELLSFWSLGYGEAPAFGASGFGRFSSDLLTFFNSMDRGVLSSFSLNFEQFEGFSYLGAGIIVGLAISIIHSRRIAWSRPFLIIGFISFLMFLFALSSKITVAGRSIADVSSFYALLEPIPSALRASGRLSGPLHYWIIIFVLYSVFNAYKKRALIVICLLIALQIGDLGEWIFKRENWVKDYPWRRVHSEKWSEFVLGKKHLAMVPIHFVMSNCYGSPRGSYGFNHDDLMSLSLLAAKNKMTINSGLDPRGDYLAYAEECALLPKLLQLGKIESRTLFVVHPLYLDQFSKDAGAKVKCESVDSFYACQLLN